MTPSPWPRERLHDTVHAQARRVRRGRPEDPGAGAERLFRHPLLPRAATTPREGFKGRLHPHERAGDVEGRATTPVEFADQRGRGRPGSPYGRLRHQAAVQTLALRRLEVRAQQPFIIKDSRDIS